MSKERIDVRLVREGFAPSREKAKELIESGAVRCEGRIVNKAGAMAEPAEEIRVEESSAFRYVSRGGKKLEKALAEFAIDLTGKTCIDAGASTGGFTDCMLQNGAEHVYAVDVGHSQLAKVLREDPRVTSLEGVNVRYLPADLIPVRCDFLTADLSFISLTKVLAGLSNFLTEDGEMVCLIKPQFEAGRARVGKKGVVRDASVHLEVLRSLSAWCKAQGLLPMGLTFSPVRGAEGNIEYLLHLGKNGDRSAPDWEQRIQDVVRHSHEEL